MKSNQTLGNFIRNARKAKNYYQRELAELVGIDFSYLSRIENDLINCPPKEKTLKAIAQHLDLNAEELIFLSGRVPQKHKQFIKENYEKMPIFFRRLRENPEKLKKISNHSQIISLNDRYKSTLVL